jgi:hypothetical protein
VLWHHLVVAEDLAALWRWFADTQCRGYSPLYDKICRTVATTPELLDMVAEAPSPAHLPNVLLAAVHYLLLDEPDHPLARIYTGIACDGDESRDAGSLFVEICRSRREDIAKLLGSRHTNTNEVGRSALVAPALAVVASSLGEPLALVDVGCSAGLNLLCDRYRLDYGTAGSTGPADAAVVVQCELAGEGQPPIKPMVPPIIDRVGIDRDSVDVQDDDQVRWQLACVWPDTGRLQRTRVALAEARRARLRVVEADAVEIIGEVVRGLTEHAVATVVTTWAFAYLPEERRQLFVDELRALARRRPVAWVSGEGGRVVSYFASVEPPVDAMGTTASVLGLVVFDGSEERSTLLGFAHPHGLWLDWRA